VKFPRMNIDEEFKTVDAVIASNAATYAVDAFALSLIKAERQARKLFTYLVFQFPAFTKSDVPALRAALESNRCVYFDGVLAGFNTLYPQSIETLVGPDYQRLKLRLDEASSHRNKIFHGQLTAQALRRADLVSLISDIRMWCGHLARGAFGEFGYDGFGRNSFAKSARADLWRCFRVQFNNVLDYEAFIRRHMQR
jgi:hypothetical protein